MSSLETTAPAFVAMAHRIVWCTVATVDASGLPRTRILHPVWEWDGAALTGWIATYPASPKAADLAVHPQVSLTYWAPDHDTCTADCATSWEETLEGKTATWDRFRNAPAPVGFDPSIIEGWTGPDAPRFGVIRLEPYRLRLMPGALMMEGKGERLAWRGK